MNMQVFAHTGLLYFVKKRDFFFLDSLGVENVPEEIKDIIKT